MYFQIENVKFALFGLIKKSIRKVITFSIAYKYLKVVI
jgi:hypothetical protein